MARLTLFCMVIAAVLAMTCAQLGGQSMGGQTAGGGQSGSGLMNMNNPMSMFMWSRIFDMNPFWMYMLNGLTGGMGGGMGGMSSIMPWLFFRNIY